MAVPQEETKPSRTSSPTPSYSRMPASSEGSAAAAAERRHALEREQAREQQRQKAQKVEDKVKATAETVSRAVRIGEEKLRQGEVSAALDAINEAATASATAAGCDCLSLKLLICRLSTQVSSEIEAHKSEAIAVRLHPALHIKYCIIRTLCIQSTA